MMIAAPPPTILTPLPQAFRLGPRRLKSWAGRKPSPCRRRSDCHGDRLHEKRGRPTTEEGALAVTVTSPFQEVTTWLLTIMPSGRATRSPDARSRSSILSCAVARRKKENRWVGERPGPEFSTGPQLRDDLAIAIILRGTTPSGNCLCTFARRVDAPTATSTASRRRGRMKTPSPRPRHVQGHSRHRVAWHGRAGRANITRRPPSHLNGTSRRPSVGTWPRSRRRFGTVSGRNE